MATLEQGVSILTKQRGVARSDNLRVIISTAVGFLRVGILDKDKECHVLRAREL